MLKLFILSLFLFSCVPVKTSFRYKYYEKNIPEPNKQTEPPISSASEQIETSEPPSDAKSFISQWLGVKYQFGGMSMSGIDCSALTQKFFSSVFNKSIKRTSILQFRDGAVVRKSELKFGDLVFFKNVRSNASVDHVGVYLNNSNFLHSSTSKGVMISSLNDSYFKPRFIAGRRLTD